MEKKVNPPRDNEATPVVGERLHPRTMSSQRLLMETFGRLAMGVQPLTQWAPVFSNPQLMDLPGLRCKGFTVWFPTMLDFVGDGIPAISQLGSEIEARGVNDKGVLALADQLGSNYRDLLARFNREEQLYINDRRLQNVHGLVSQFYRPVVGVRWYNSKNGVVTRERLEDEEYQRIMGRFYPTMQASTLALIDRCVTSLEWIAVGTSVQNEMSMESLFLRAAELGIVAGD